MVKPYDWLFGLLNKKKSQKDNYFEQSTCKEPSWFEYFECDFFFLNKKFVELGSREM